MNVDHVAQQLESQGHRGVQVRGLSDSGWLVERKKYKFGDCTDILNCGPISFVKRGIRWETRVAKKTNGCLRSTDVVQVMMLCCHAGSGEPSCQRTADGLTWEQSGTVSSDIKSTPR